MTTCTSHEENRKLHLLFTQKVTAEGHHAEEDFDHLLHHEDLPPQIVLALLAVSVHGDVETLVKLSGGEGQPCVRAWILFYDLHCCCKLFTAVTPHNVVFNNFEAPFYFLQDICY